MNSLLGPPILLSCNTFTECEGEIFIDNVNASDTGFEEGVIISEIESDVEEGICDNESDIEEDVIVSNIESDVEEGVIVDIESDVEGVIVSDIESDVEEGVIVSDIESDVDEGFTFLITQMKLIACRNPHVSSGSVGPPPPCLGTIMHLLLFSTAPTAASKLFL